MDSDARAFLAQLPVLGPGETFEFACHPGRSCFNACCGDLDLTLPPFDALRLRRALGVTFRELTSRSVSLQAGAGYDLPIATVVMDTSTAGHPCPFVGPDGCTVYGGRPSACRTYPLGRGAWINARGEIEEQYVVVQESHCRGFDGSARWTRESWLQDQGLKPYLASNDRHLRLATTLAQRGRPLTADERRLAIDALYQPEVFRARARREEIPRQLSWPAPRIAAVWDDDALCLELGYDWLTRRLLR